MTMTSSPQPAEKEARASSPAAPSAGVKSMTGFAQVRHQFDQLTSFVLSLKSVNHRYLDLHLRLPPDSEALEMKLRRALKDKLVRGHIELILGIERRGSASLDINKELVGGFVQAFRIAAKEFGLSSQPDLNSVLRIPGMLTVSSLAGDNEQFEHAVLAQLDVAITKLNEMREHEGSALAEELRLRMRQLALITDAIERLRGPVSRAYREKIQRRMAELITNRIDPERIAQEAALLTERSDIQEEVVRLRNHTSHFVRLLDAGGEAGKKLDFLLQELNREANTLLAKTAGISGEGLRITEFGLEMKSEIEKCREQIQNLE